MLGRLPSSDEPCWLVAGRELEDPRGASRAKAGVPARTPTAVGKEGELPGVYASAHMPKDTSQRA